MSRTVIGLVLGLSGMAALSAPPVRAESGAAAGGAPVAGPAAAGEAPVAGPAAADSGQPASSPWIPVGLSLGLTTVGYGAAFISQLPRTDATTTRDVVFVSGLTLGLLGPAAGHVWRGDWLRAGLFTAGRLALGGLVLYEVEYLIAHTDSSEPGRYDPHPIFQETVLFGALAGIAVLTVWETVDAYQRERAGVTRPPRAAAVAIAPFVAPAAVAVATASVPAWTVAGGLQAVGRF